MLKKSHFFCFILIAVAIYIYADNNNLKTLTYVFKPLATILVILIPLQFTTPSSKYKTHILLGLCFCLLGDIFLLFDSLFILGLIAFLIGHIIFIKAFTLFNGFIKNYKVLTLLLIYALIYFAYIRSSLNDLLIPVIFYILCILIMSWQGLSLYLYKRHKAFKLIAIAVSLFFISDSVLALNKFKETIPFAKTIISLTYWVSISLIALSVTLLPKSLTKNKAL